MVFNSFRLEVYRNIFKLKILPKYIQINKYVSVFSTCIEYMNWKCLLINDVKYKIYNKISIIFSYLRYEIFYSQQAHQKLEIRNQLAKNVNNYVNIRIN